MFEIVPFKVTGRAVEPDLRGEQREPGVELAEGASESGYASRAPSVRLASEMPR